jgi:hypothetical protein
VKILGNLASDFDFDQSPRAPVLLPVHPKTTLTGTPKPSQVPAAARARDPDG